MVIVMVLLLMLLMMMVVVLTLLLLLMMIVLWIVMVMLQLIAMRLIAACMPGYRARSSAASLQMLECVVQIGAFVWRQLCKTIQCFEGICARVGVVV